MFSLFGRKKPNNDEEYEKTLADLDGKIRRAERYISELKQRESKSIAAATFYSAAAYVLYLGYYILAVYLPGKNSGYSELAWVGLTLAALILPVIMWYFVGILRWLHRRRQASEKKQLETLQKSQKETLEELKKRTKFDKTKSLIEKYEGTPRRSGSGTGLADLGSGTPATQSGLRRPPPFVTPSKMAPGSAPSTPATPANLPGSLMSPPAPVPRPALIVGIDSSLRAAVPPGPPSAGTTYDTPRAWYDKLFDALIGPPEGPNSKYALICSKCFAHNGLALAEEFDDIQFYCFRCQHFNSRRKGKHDSGEDKEHRGRSRSAGSVDNEPPSPQVTRMPSGSFEIGSSGGEEADDPAESLSGEDGADDTGSLVEMDLDEPEGTGH